MVFCCCFVDVMEMLKGWIGCFFFVVLVRRNRGREIVSTFSLSLSPLCLLIAFECNVHSLSFGIFTGNRIALFHIAILFQQWLHIGKVGIVWYSANNYFRCLTAKLTVFFLFKPK